MNVPNEIADRFADFTDLDTVEDVAIRVWFLSNGDIYEEREDRPSTRVFSRRVFHVRSEHAEAWEEKIVEARRADGASAAACS